MSAVAAELHGDCTRRLHFLPWGFVKGMDLTQTSNLDLLKVTTSNCSLLWYLVEYYSLMSVHTISC